MKAENWWYYYQMEDEIKGIIVATAITIAWIVGLFYWFFVVEEGLQYLQVVFAVVFYGAVLSVFIWMASFLTYIDKKQNKKIKYTGVHIQNNTTQIDSDKGEYDNLGSDVCNIDYKNEMRRIRGEDK